MRSNGGQGLANTIENSEFGLNLNWIPKFFSNFPYVIKFENCERDGLDLLQMTRDTQWWWWHSKIKRISNFQSGCDVEFIKNSQLCLSIVLNLG